jgi:uncharacterized membrane protein
MNLRIALYELASAHRLAPGALHRLQGLAGLHDEPSALRRWLPRAIAILAAALGGFGIVLWVAANWDTFGRFGRFALLQFAVLAGCAGALWRPGARAPFGLLALLGIGGLFAYFGQTYQTGADPWQLFALWAVLALPLCLAVRSDVLWTPWAVVVMTAISLWIFAHAGHRWRVSPDDLQVHALGWSLSVALAIGLSHALRAYTGAGAWSLRTAVTLAVVLFALTGIGGLFHQAVAPHYVLALVLLTGAAALLTQRAAFDVFALSAVALGLNVLLVGGLVRLLFESHNGEPIGSLFMIGLAAAGLLAGSVSVILRLARRYQAEEPAEARPEGEAA